VERARMASASKALRTSRSVTTGRPPALLAIPKGQGLAIGNKQQMHIEENWPWPKVLSGQVCSHHPLFNRHPQMVTFNEERAAKVGQ
jgi:hypothetical protein